MDREPFVSSFFLSATLHVLCVLSFQLGLFGSLESQVDWSSSPLTVDLVGPRLSTSALPPAAAPAPTAPIAMPAPPPPLAPKISPPVRPVQPKRHRTVEGVRIASADEVRIRRLMGELPFPVTEPVKPQPAPEVPPAPPPQPEVAAAAAPVPPAQSVPGPSIVALAGFAKGAGTITTTVFPDHANEHLPGGGFRPDTPGYYGRMFGQVSVAGSKGSGSYYGRIHLFPDSGWYRDYSRKSLFGYSFRHELGDGALREFQTGRTQTPGAYLIVTDLFPNGRISTMSHTVILAFPRVPARGSQLYDVVEEAGDFRLVAPGGAFLRFDGRTGALEETRGFRVESLAGVGTPPRVRFRGLHLRIEAVGGNPFLRDRAARMIDRAGRECSLSTSELFVYEGRDESDVFRFADDRRFFRFLGRRCPGLDLPRPATAQVAAPRKEPGSASAAMGSGGLLPGIFGER